ncbi:hypothetical protein [Edaphobacillus lindanitolerans]|uniref:Short-chain dehydrogenase n=1 Tax=Edaphobacillus lindanitolerans TaxID=550447 RepID=A0A1U7PHL3_9BACI|nr:hypothetical protein [Edaphobacillus lindanitolerans]SIT68414.1 hypothetical protein SAMN05428946_0363 [Edaphobacillus lindanitolerans]
MEIWLWPLIGIILLIAAIGIAMSRKMDGMIPENGRDEIPAEVRDHPFKFNPLLIVIGISVVFVGIVIFYYAFIW